MAVTAKKVAPAGPDRGSKLTLAFGMVSVPVRYKPVTETKRPVSATLMCPEHGPSLKQHYKCSQDTPDEHEIEKSEIVKGYPHPDDSSKLVEVDPSVLEEFAESRTGMATITKTVDVDEIDPAFFDKTYLVWPDAGGEAAFDLLSIALAEDRRAAVVTTPLGKQTRMMVFRWSEELECVLAHVLSFTSQLRLADVEKVQSSTRNREAPPSDQVALAKQLLASIHGEFDAEEVEDTYTPLVHDAIRQVAKGDKVISRKAEEAPATGTADLMAALQASVEAAKPVKKTARKKVPA